MRYSIHNLFTVGEIMTLSIEYVEWNTSIRLYGSIGVHLIDNDDNPVAATVADADGAMEAMKRRRRC